MSYKKANNILVILILLVNVYVVGAPFLPSLLFWWQSNHTAARQQLSNQIRQSPPTSRASKPTPNHIVIPDMLLNKPIYDGTIANTYRTLDKGIWRWPRTSVPGQTGNTVLIGHRFTYTNPRGIFYALDKVKLGSQIAVYWSNVKYLYRVRSIKVVPATDTAIEAQTSDTRLTLYTCTPLWHPVDRLVVVATPEVST